MYLENVVGVLGGSAMVRGGRLARRSDVRLWRRRADSGRCGPVIRGRLGSVWQRILESKCNGGLVTSGSSFCFPLSSPSPVFVCTVRVGSDGRRSAVLVAPWPRDKGR